MIEKSLPAMIQMCFFGSLAAVLASQAQIDQFQLLEDSYELTRGVKLHTLYANHPTTTLGFKFEINGKKIIYCPDSEVMGKMSPLFRIMMKNYLIFARGRSFHS